MKLVRRLWFWLHRRQLETEFEEEVRQHLEWKSQAAIDQGMPAQEARRAAHLDFGNPALAKEDSRRSWGVPSLESVLHDLRYGARQLRKNPGFTTVAILTLALGIGANSAMFSFVNAFLLTSLPVKDPQELVQIRNDGSDFEQKAYKFLRDHNHTLAGLIAWDEGTIAINIDGQVNVVPIDFVSANLYSLLGVPAYRGRVLTPDDDLPGKPAVAVISYDYWQRRFAFDPAVIGKRVEFKDVSCTIVGVAPPWFHGLRIGGAALPVTLPAQWHQHLTLNDNTTFTLFGRLARGVDMSTAQSELNLLYHQELQAEASEQRKNLLERRIVLVPARVGARAFNRRFALELRVLEAVVGLVLLIACVNLANLLLARGNARRREIGIRLALGARRSRIVRQLLTENLLLALSGGALGLLLSAQLTRVLLLVLKGRSDTASLGVHVDSAVLAFTITVSLATGLIFGLAPALRSSRGTMTAEFAGDLSSRHKSARSSRILVAPQIAISLVVLVLSGLLLRSLQRLHEVDLGFRHDHLLSFWLWPTLSGYDGDRELHLYDSVLTRLNQLPGVRVASLSRWSLLRRGRRRGLEVDGVSYPEVQVVLGSVSPRFFDTLDLPILLGRDFTAQDTGKSPSVAIINESAAQKYFSGESAVGHRITLTEADPKVERTVVGVVKNMRFSLRSDMPVEAVYIPYAQSPAENRGQAMIKVSTNLDPEALHPSIQRQVASIAGDLPAIQIEKEDDLINDETEQESSLSRLLTGFGILAAGLALLGLYGTVAYSVSRRVREIAIRMALGAQHAGVVRMIVSESMRVVLTGALAGALLAMLASRTLESFLFEVKGFDLLTYSATLLTLLLAAAVIAYLPARRAARVDPMIALRHE